MEKTENQSNAPSRDKLLSLAQKYYPDRLFAGQTGPDGQEGTEDLEEAIAEMVQKLQDENTSRKKDNDDLVALFKKSPIAAEFVNKWIKNGDPFGAFVEMFGDEFFGMDADEAKNKFKEQYDGWNSRRDANSALEEESKTNWDHSLEELDAWGDEKGLDTDQKVEIITRLVGISANGVANIYERDDFQMVYSAMHHDEDVNNARHEGEVSGRNAKIKAARIERATAGAMPPVSRGGQRSSIEENRPVKEASPFSGIE